LTKPNIKDYISDFRFRGLRPNWNIGVMEWWNDGFEGILSILNSLFNFYYPIFHISLRSVGSTSQRPASHYSGWIEFGYIS
jgi:hypothetical protein